MKGDSGMSNHEEANARNEPVENPSPRRAYVKPEFSCEQVFESTALHCGTKGPSS